MTWNGSDWLKDFLVPITDLKPFPGNPRRGDLARVRESLQEYGQTRPILTDPNNTIVAGHHVVLAATELGWTHVAAIPNEFKSEDAARRYLLMDNRSHDTGDYDLDGLHAALSALREEGFAGTGYDEAYFKALDRDLAKLREEADPPDHFPPLDPGNLETQYRCPSCQYEWSGNPAP